MFHLRERNFLSLLTCVHLAILSRRSFRNDALDLQELVRFVTTNDGEAEAHVALLQHRREERPFEL